MDKREDGTLSIVVQTSPIYCSEVIDVEIIYKKNDNCTINFLLIKNIFKKKSPITVKQLKIVIFSASSETSHKIGPSGQDFEIFYGLHIIFQKILCLTDETTENKYLIFDIPLSHLANMVIIQDVQESPNHI